MRHQVRRSVQSAYSAAHVDRPLTPRLLPWQAPRPHGVAAILSRNVLAEQLRDTYAPWATNFVVLEADFVEQLNRHTMRGRWTYDPLSECAKFALEDHVFWIQKQLEGWTIELCHPDERHPDTRILALGRMPVLCQDGSSAGKLAQTCFGKTPGGLTWRPFW